MTPPFHDYGLASRTDLIRVSNKCRQLDRLETRTCGGQVKCNRNHCLPLPKQFQGDGMRRIPLEQPLEHSRWPPGSTGAEVDLRERDVAVLELRGSLQRILEERDGRVRLPLRDEHEREVVGRLAVVGAPAERVAEVAFRPIQVARATEEQPEIVERFGKVRLERERLLVERARFLVVPGQEQRVAEVVRARRDSRASTRARRGTARSPPSRSPPCASSAPRSLLRLGEVGLAARARARTPTRARAVSPLFASSVPSRYSVDALGFACAARSKATTAAGLQPLIEQLPPVRQVVAQRQRR